MLAKPILLPKVDACGSARREKGDAVRSPDGVVRAESRAGDRDGRESRSVMGSRVAPSEPRIHESSAPHHFFSRLLKSVRDRCGSLLVDASNAFRSFGLALPSLRGAPRGRRARSPRARSPRVLPRFTTSTVRPTPRPPLPARGFGFGLGLARETLSARTANGCASSVAPHLPPPPLRPRPRPRSRPPRGDLCCTLDVADLEPGVRAGLAVTQRLPPPQGASGSKSGGACARGAAAFRCSERRLPSDGGPPLPRAAGDVRVIARAGDGIALVWTLHPDDRARLYQSMYQLEYRPGEAVVRQGEEGRNFTSSSTATSPSPSRRNPRRTKTRTPSTPPTRGCRRRTPLAPAPPPPRALLPEPRPSPR